jgi:RNA polymerase sigma-70 factor (ECF subfamily)
VPAWLAGVERTDAGVQETRQLLRERLFLGGPDAKPKILEYSGRGSLASWLRVVALRVAHNRRRGALRDTVELDEAGDAPELLHAVDPELAIIRARYQREFGDALREAFAALQPRDRVVFRMHFLDGLNIERIGVVFQVHRATVARWIAAGREELCERTLALLGDKLRLDAKELESLLALVRSQLDLSLRTILREKEQG